MTPGKWSSYSIPDPKEGTTLIDASLRLGEAVPPTESSPGQVFVLKSIPSARRSTTLDVKQLTSALIRDRKNAEVHPGEATLQLDSTASDPLGMIPVVEIMGGVYSKGGFVLDYGEILYDYLAEESTGAGSSQKDE